VRVPHGFASFPGAVRTGAQHRSELVTELRSHLCAVGGDGGTTAG
jgi:acetyl esterase